MIQNSYLFSQKDNFYCLSISLMQIKRYKMHNDINHYKELVFKGTNWCCYHILIWYEMKKHRYMLGDEQRIMFIPYSYTNVYLRFACLLIWLQVKDAHNQNLYDCMRQVHSIASCIKETTFFKKNSQRYDPELFGLSIEKKGGAYLCYILIN